MLAQREGFMISPASAAKFGDNLGQNPVGTGPFVFKSWTPGQQIVVERNPDYWEPGKPYLDRVVFMLISNAAIGIPRLVTRGSRFRRRADACRHPAAGEAERHHSFAEPGQPLARPANARRPARLSTIRSSVRRWRTPSTGSAWSISS